MISGTTCKGATPATIGPRGSLPGRAARERTATGCWSNRTTPVRFSASAGFVNRFATLHPEAVRAIAVGAINALPMYPLEGYQGVKLPFPLGIADLKSLTGADFDAKAYGQVSQFLYMGIWTAT